MQDQFFGATRKQKTLGLCFFFFISWSVLLAAHITVTYIYIYNYINDPEIRCASPHTSHSESLVSVEKGSENFPLKRRPDLLCRKRRASVIIICESFLSWPANSSRICVCLKGAWQPRGTTGNRWLGEGRGGSPNKP